MVKTPKTRHSKTEHDPVTIELGPGEVSRVEPVAETTAKPDAENFPETAMQEPVAGGDPAEDAAEEATDPADGLEIEASRQAAADETNSAGESNGPDEPDETVHGGEQYQNVQQARRPSRAPMFGAGVIGGVVALAAAGLLQYGGLIGTPGASGGQATPTVPASVESDIAALRSEIEALKASSSALADVSGLTSQLDGLSQDLDQVKSEVASLKQSVETGGGGDGAAIDAMNAKIGEIENRIAAISPSNDSADAQDIAALKESIASIEAQVTAARDLDADLSRRISTLEQSMSKIGAKVDAQAGQPKVALAISAAALRSAIEHGFPFKSEIETFAAIAPDTPGLAELRAYSAQGVATRESLAAEMDAAARAIIAAADPPPPDAGFLERLLDSAEALVAIRPIGEVEGPGVPETLARMEVALRAGDLGKALAEFDTLPEAAQSAGAAFANRIRARLTVEQLADQAIALAMQA